MLVHEEFPPTTTRGDWIRGVCRRDGEIRRLSALVDTLISAIVLLARRVCCPCPTPPAPTVTLRLGRVTIPHYSPLETKLMPEITLQNGTPRGSPECLVNAQIAFDVAVDGPPSWENGDPGRCTVRPALDGLSADIESVPGSRGDATVRIHATVNGVDLDTPFLVHVVEGGAPGTGTVTFGPLMPRP